MSFADLVQQQLTRSADHPPSSALKRSLAKAAVGALGLAGLPLAMGGAPTAPALKMLGALLVLCVAAFFALRLVARRALAAESSPLRVLARASLSPKNGVAILEADGRRYLVAFGDGYTSVLSGDPR